MKATGAIVAGGWRRWVALAALALLLATALVTLARLLGFEWGPLAMIVALTPWFALPALLALVLALGARSWWIAAASAGVLVLHGTWLAPLWTAAGPAGPTLLTVATVNAAYGEADAEQIVALVADRDVDVLSVQELTPSLVEELEAEGLERLLPHAVVRAEPDYSGVGLWSRVPLDDATVLDELGSWAVAARVEFEGTEVDFLAVHPVAPGVRGHATWSRDLETLVSLAGESKGPTMLLGDFNTTRDHAAFRQLESLGFRDESDEAGSGLRFTFPQGRGPFPFVAIDHVLVRDAPWQASGTETVVMDGTDHRALVVTYSAK